MIRRTACLIAREYDPFRNLALEKHLMDTLPEDTAILYLWRNARTIVIGRNQNPWQECLVEEFLESGGSIARRLSGGGAVYHDLGNVNYTFILPKDEFSVPAQLGVVSAALSRFGLRAEITGRNDMAIGGRKFSGSAYFSSGRSSFHHGTIMVDVSENEMSKYLTPDAEKMASRGVASVSSRVMSLIELCPKITIDEVFEQLYYAFGAHFGQKPSMLDEKMLDQPTVELITSRFQDNDWIYPEALKYTFSARERFPWGGVTVKLLVKSGMIKTVKVFTDSLEIDLFERIEDALTGSPFLISAIGGRFEDRLGLIGDAPLKQMAADVEQLICSRMRALDRRGEDAK